MSAAYTFRSGPLRLAGHLSLPKSPASSPPPGLVLCHGFPAVPGGAAASGGTYPDLADRIAADAGWVVLTFTFRGAGESEGDFSLGGWLDDVRAAVDHLLATEDVSGVWVAGSSTGGGLALCLAAEDDRVRGVAALAAPAEFTPWAADPVVFLGHARAMGVISTPGYPDDFSGWSRELSEISPVSAIGKIPPRPILLVHGTDDETVPPDDARQLADAAQGPSGPTEREAQGPSGPTEREAQGPSGPTERETPGPIDLVMLDHAAHRLRHDPRAVAVLIGWLDRHRQGR